MDNWDKVTIHNSEGAQLDTDPVWYINPKKWDIIADELLDLFKKGLIDKATLKDLLKLPKRARYDG